MSYLIKRIYDGLLFKTDSLTFHPYVGLILIIVQFAMLISSNNLALIILFSFVIVENFLFKNIRGALSIIYAILPLVIFLGGLTFVFSGLDVAFRAILRVFIGGLSFSFYFAVTNPSELTRALENLHLPSKIAFLPSLVLTLSPRIAKDADETLETLRLRGITDSLSLNWLPKMIAIFLASVLYRSEFLAQALYYKGFGLKKRTHYKQISFSKINWIRIVYWIIEITLYALAHVYFPNFLTKQLQVTI